MDMSTMTMVGVAVAFVGLAVGVLLGAMLGVRWVARRSESSGSAPTTAPEPTEPALEPMSPGSEPQDP